MEVKKVRDLMIPLEKYARVHQDSTIYDAILAIHKSQKALSNTLQPIRAVLVVDDHGNIVGKMGHLAFLKALELKYDDEKDFEKLTNAGVNSDFISSITDNLRWWQDDLVDIAKRAQLIKVKDTMNPVSESIGEEATLTEAIHRIIDLQSLSLLVKSGSKVIGILRLSDLYHEVERSIICEFDVKN